MPTSLRTFRAALYGGADVNAGGYASMQYARVPSPDTDRRWWASLAAATGRERTAGGQAEASVDVVIGLDAHVDVPASPLVEIDGRFYKITATLPRPHGADEQQLLGVFADTATFTLDEGDG